MEKYVVDTIKEFLEDITTSVVTPAADNISGVRDMAVRLEDAEGRAFHRSKESLLFLNKIPRPEIVCSRMLLSGTPSTTPQYSFPV